MYARRYLAISHASPGAYEQRLISPRIKAMMVEQAETAQVVCVYVT